MSNAITAVECFNKGYNCAQAVVSSYCEQLGLDKDSALKISYGFGGGMGRLGEVCGAVTGANMLISLKYGSIAPDKEAKEKTYAAIQEFARRFRERNGSIRCKELLGVDLLTGDKNMAAQRVKSVCPKAVQDAVEIIEEMLDFK